MIDHAHFRGKKFYRGIVFAEGVRGGIRIKASGNIFLFEQAIDEMKDLGGPFELYVDVTFDTSPAGKKISIIEACFIK